MASLKVENNHGLIDFIIKIPSLTRETTIKSFIATMEKHNIDFLPVIEHGVLLGVVTEKDLIKFIRAQPVTGIQAIVIHNIPNDIMKRKVSEIMTRHPIAINHKDSVNDTIKKMTANNLKRVVVLDDNKKVLGIIKLRDLFKKL